MKNNFHKKLFSKSIFLFIMAALLGLSFFDYGQQNEARIKENLQSITKENNEQVNVAIAEKLQDELHILESYAFLISDLDDITGDEAFRRLEPLQKTELFTRIAVTKPDGISYTSDHFQHDSSDRMYYIEGMKGNPYISNLTKSMIDGTEVVLISVPIYRKDKVVGVLRATIDIKVLNEYFKLSFLSGAVSSFLIQKDGRNLTPSEMSEGDFFTMLKSSPYNTELIDKMKDDLKQDRAGSITFILDNKTRYAYYIPVKNTDWYTLTILPFTTVEAEMEYNFQQTLLLAFKISAVVLLTCIYFFYQQYRSAKATQEINKQMDAIIANTPGTSYKYELPKPETVVFFKEDNRLMLGYTREEISAIIKHDIYLLIFKDDYKNMKKSLKKLKPNQVVTNTYRVRNKQNEVLWIYDQRQIIQEGNKRICFVEVMDITDMKMTQEQLKISEERYQMILKETQSVIFEWNLQTDEISFSDYWTTKYGYPKEMKDFLVLTTKRFGQSEYSYIPLLEGIVSGLVQSDQIECILPKANGEEVWVRIFAKAILDDQGYLLRIVGNITDISQEKMKSLQLLERAQRDGLTRVYNKMTLENMVASRLENEAHRSHILFVIDIDDFKSINDSLGHSCGDEALTKFSQALTSCFRKSDIIGRIGGDEFVVFVEYDEDHMEEQIEKKCTMFLTAISNIRLTQNMDYRMQCSVGVSIHPRDGDTYQSLFECADRRLYKAKKKGKNTFVYQDVENS